MNWICSEGLGDVPGQHLPVSGSIPMHVDGQRAFSLRCYASGARMSAFSWWPSFFSPDKDRDLLETGRAGRSSRCLPLEAVSSLDQGISAMWQQYVALQHVADENRRLRQEMDWLRGENNELREAAAATQRLHALLQFKEHSSPTLVAAQVIGRDCEQLVPSGHPQQRGKRRHS